MVDIVPDKRGLSGQKRDKSGVLDWQENWPDKFQENLLWFCDIWIEQITND